MLITEASYFKIALDHARKAAISEMIQKTDQLTRLRNFCNNLKSLIDDLCEESFSSCSTRRIDADGTIWEEHRQTSDVMPNKAKYAVLQQLVDLISCLNQRLYPDNCEVRAQILNAMRPSLQFRYHTVFDQNGSSQYANNQIQDTVGMLYPTNACLVDVLRYIREAQLGQHTVYEVVDYIMDSLFQMNNDTVVDVYGYMPPVSAMTTAKYGFRIFGCSKWIPVNENSGYETLVANHDYCYPVKSINRVLQIVDDFEKAAQSMKMIGSTVYDLMTTVQSVASFSGDENHTPGDMYLKLYSQAIMAYRDWADNLLKLPYDMGKGVVGTFNRIGTISSLGGEGAYWSPRLLYLSDQMVRGRYIQNGMSTTYMYPSCSWIGGDELEQALCYFSRDFLAWCLEIYNSRIK